MSVQLLTASVSRLMCIIFFLIRKFAITYTAFLKQQQSLEMSYLVETWSVMKYVSKPFWKNFGKSSLRVHL